MNTKIIFLFFIIFLVVSCHKDESILNETIISSTSPQIFEQINGTVIGYVSDETNNPISNALVKVYDRTTTTNDFGVFEFENIQLDKQGTFVRVIKDGFVNGSDKVYPLESEVFSSIKMIRLETGKSFDSESGGEIAITGGGKVVFPPNGIALQNGEPYNGIVNVTARLLDPNSPFLLDLMPGSLEGIASNQHNVVLATAGMIAVELRDSQGRNLNMKKESKASLEIPALVASPPSTIPMWYFDMEKGLWIEEGTAILEDGFYKTEVSHFSFWNCDVPYPLINVSGKVLFSDGTPIRFQRVCVETKQGGLVTSSFGFTDANGCFSGKMPKGQELEFTIKIAGCEEEELFVETLGPFSQNVVLDPFIITSGLLTSVSGTVTCNGEPYFNSLIVRIYENETLVLAPNQGGSFSFLECLSGSEKFEIFAFNLDDNRSSETIEITSGTIDNINLDVCGDPCDFDVEFDYDCVNNLLTINIIGSLSNYEIIWDDGRTDAAIVIDESEFNSIKCVEVGNPSLSCLESFCFSIPTALPFSLNYNCIDNFICPNIWEPGTIYEWSDGSTGFCLFPVSPGTYSLTLTDPAGCQSLASIDIGEISDPLYIDEKITDCDRHLYSIITSEFGSGWFYSSMGGFNVQFPVTNLSVFDTGYGIGLEIVNNSGNCSTSTDVRQPQFQASGLIIDNVQFTSCATCVDGQIEASLLPGTNCFDCVVGDIIIVDVAIPHNDRTAENNAGSLPAGEYYVVVTDADSGCYVAFKKVEVE